MNASGLSDDEERSLLEVLKTQPDFDSLPIPAYWFKKYNLPPRTATGPSEYIESNYAMKRANENKDLPPIIIDTPQQDGKLYPVAPAEAIEIEVRSRPFEWKGNTPFPAQFVAEHTATTPEPHSPSSLHGMSRMSPYPVQDDQHESETDSQAPPQPTS